MGRTWDFELQNLETRTMFAGCPLSVTEVAWNGGIQLRINGTSRNDAITLNRTVDGLVIGSLGGWSFTASGTYNSIRIDGGAGNDRITLSPTVTDNTIIYGSAGNDAITGGSGNDVIYGRAGDDSLFGAAGNDTLVDIGGGSADKLTGGTGLDSFWFDNSKTEHVLDPEAAENTAGAFHKMKSFKALSFGTTLVQVGRDLVGQRLRDPIADAGYSCFSDRPLFSDNGPSADDVKQGSVGDCYFLSTLAAVAKTNPEVIRQSIVDLGDGTFAVQFGAPGQAKSVFRVDNDLASWGSQPMYAKLGQGNSMWVAIMEKAYTFYRRGEGTYASINAGWMSEAFSALGKSASSIWSYSGSAGNGASLIAQIQALLDGGKAVTVGIIDAPSNLNLVTGHAYTVDAVVANSDGSFSLRLRNPWGFDGYSSNDGANDGYVTLSASQAFSMFAASGSNCFQSATV